MWIVRVKMTSTSWINVCGSFTMCASVFDICLHCLHSRCFQLQFQHFHVSVRTFLAFFRALNKQFYRSFFINVSCIAISPSCATGSLCQALNNDLNSCLFNGQLSLRSELYSRCILLPFYGHSQNALPPLTQELLISAASLVIHWFTIS